MSKAAAVKANRKYLNSLSIFAAGILSMIMILLASCQPAEEAPRIYDTLIINGTVYDGSGSPGKPVNIGIQGDRVLYMGAPGAKRPAAQRVIDATGLVVAPGFIDPHNHTVDNLRDKDNYKHLNVAYLTQGVTTIFNGNDGVGTAQVAKMRDTLAAGGIGVNVALFVGHGEIRRTVMGNAMRAPTPQEMDTMKTLVRSAMAQGALGLSTGLYYVPGNFATTDEIVELAKIAAEYGGIYESHIRDESSYDGGLIAAVKEAIDIGARAGLPVHIAHIKALGVDVWGQSRQVIKLIEQARRRGQQVTADQYPWRASQPSLRSSLVPHWALEGSEDAIQSRLKTPELREKIIAEMMDNLHRRGGADSFLIITPESPWQGKTLAEVATATGLSPVLAALQIITTKPGGNLSLASFNMSEEDVVAFMQQSWVVTSSDGDNRSRHPRTVASYPKKYWRYVKKEKRLTLAEFIHRSSGLTADTFKLVDRGYLKSGYFADVVIFDPQSYRPQATYKNPAALSQGVQYLFVNGQAVIDNGKVQSVYAGRPLQKAASTQTAISTPAKTIRVATFDSGFGGFFTAKSVEETSRDLLKQYDTAISIKHYGDTQNAPYGEKTPQQIAELASRGVLNALDQGADKVFIACNTASTQYDKIREAVESFYPGRSRDVISIVEASITQAKAIIDRRLQDYDEAFFAILATPATVKSMVYPRRLAALYAVAAEEQPVHSFRQPRWFKAKGETIESATQQTTLHLPNGKIIRIYQMAPGNWVDLIEQGGDLADKNQAVKRDMQYLFDLLPVHAKLDVVGYFCTHYPALDNAIQLEVAQHNHSRPGTGYIKQAPLMAAVFKTSAQAMLQGQQRQVAPSSEVLTALIERSRPTITLTGNNIDVTKKLARTFFPNDPEPVIVQEKRKSVPGLEPEGDAVDKTGT